MVELGQNGLLYLELRVSNLASKANLFSCRMFFFFNSELLLEAEAVACLVGPCGAVR